MDGKKSGWTAHFQAQSKETEFCKSPLELQHLLLPEGGVLPQTLLLHPLELITGGLIVLHPITHFLQRIGEGSHTTTLPDLLQHPLPLPDVVTHLQNHLQALLLDFLVLGPPCHLLFVLAECSVETPSREVNDPLLDLFILNVNVGQSTRSLVEELLQHANFVLQEALDILELVYIELQFQLQLPVALAAGGEGETDGGIAVIGAFIEEALSGETLLGILAVLPEIVLAGSGGAVGELSGLGSGSTLDGGVAVGHCRLRMLQVVLLQILLVVIQSLGTTLWHLWLFLLAGGRLGRLLVEVVVYVKGFLHELYDVRQ